MQAQYAGELTLNTKPDTEVVKILDKEYRVACTPAERESLTTAARQLDKMMRDIRNGGSVIGLERMAVMAALNLSHELLESKRQQNNHQIEQKLDQEALHRLSSKLDEALK